MIKKSVTLSVLVLLSIIGIMFVNGCDDKEAVAGESKISSCPKGTKAICPKTGESLQKEACDPNRSVSACPPDCKKECCLAQQKAGTCPSNSSQTSCPKVCPKKTSKLPE